MHEENTREFALQDSRDLIDLKCLKRYTGLSCMNAKLRMITKLVIAGEAKIETTPTVGMQLIGFEILAVIVSDDRANSNVINEER